jgi:ketosteroid isomerase-like protein
MESLLHFILFEIIAIHRVKCIRPHSGREERRGVNTSPTADDEKADAETKKEGATVMGQEAIETHNKQVVQAAFETWRKGNGSVYDLLAPNAKWTIVGNAPVSRTFANRQEFIDVVITPFNARLSRRLVPSVRGIYADGDMVIVLWDGVATARDGKPYRNTYSWFLQMRDGKIVNAVAFFDTIEFTDFWKRVPVTGR